MPVTITIHGETASQAIYEVRELAGGFAVPAVSGASSDKMTATEAVAIVEHFQPDAQVTELVVQSAPAKRTRKPKAETPPAPPPAVDGGPSMSEAATGVPAETAAQDAADEAAEDTGPVGPDGAIVYTLDDVRNAVKPYIDKWTIAVAQADVGHLIKDIGGADKISELDPTNQENLRKLVAALGVASASNTRYVKAA